MMKYFHQDLLKRGEIHSPKNSTNPIPNSWDKFLKLTFQQETSLPEGWTTFIRQIGSDDKTMVGKSPGTTFLDSC